MEGCAHGELDAIYATIAAAEKEHGIKVDLLLICGDFQVFRIGWVTDEITHSLWHGHITTYSFTHHTPQAIRNQVDLTSLACPPRYRALGTFHQYYAGKKRAPVPTIFIGGNHESSAYMLELLHGGWAAENVYYLGKAGVLRVGGVRIAGSSGIYKDHDFQKGALSRYGVTCAENILSECTSPKSRLP